MSTLASIEGALQTAIDKANTTTEGQDTNVTDAIDTLIAGYGSGGGDGYTFAWANAQTVTIGANTVANTQQAKDFFASYTYDFAVLMSPVTLNNQIAMLTASTPYRVRDDEIKSTVYGGSYDAKIVEGTTYLLLKFK